MTPERVIQEFRARMLDKQFIRERSHTEDTDDGHTGWRCIPYVDAEQALWEIILEANEEAEWAHQQVVQGRR